MPRSSEQPQRLSGGNTHEGVVRIGSTVRRPTGAWTPGVHALLRHLQSRGFDGAPRVLGVDDDGHEILTYIDGVVVWPDHFELVGDDAALRSIARLIRGYHEVVGDFDWSGFQWSDRGRDPTAAEEVLCHNDLAPWNLVHSPAGWVFIDWDLAAPGRRSWDLAWALLSLVPFFHDREVDSARVAQRVRIFSQAYGLADVPPDVIEVARERCAREAELILVRGRDGESPYDRLLSEGHYEAWALHEDHIGSHVDEWTERAFT